MIQAKTWDDMSAPTRKSLERMIKTSHTMPLQDAIDMLREMLKREPELLPARETLRELELRKADETKAKPEGGLTNFILSCKTSFAGKDHFKAIAYCEEVLAKNVNNMQALKMLATFAEKAEAYFIAADAVRTAMHFTPDDSSLKAILGEIHLKSGELDEALEIFQALFDSDPHKSSYKRYMREVNAAIEKREADELLKQEAELNKVKEKKIQSRNSQEAITQQLLEGTIRDKEQANLVISELNKALEQKDSLDIRRKLAEAYNIAEDYDSAIAHLEYVARALKAFDVNLDKDIEKLYIKKYDIAIKSIENNPSAYENPQEQLEKLEYSRIKFKLERAMRRAQASPRDAQLHYELGLEYYDCNMGAEALEEFTTAAKHPRWEPQSTYYIGRVQLNLDNIPSAVENLAKAAEMIGLREPNYKKCWYYLGIAREKNGDAEGAKQAYERLYQVDPNFLDVANRLS